MSAGLRRVLPLLLLMSWVFPACEDDSDTIFVPIQQQIQEFTGTAQDSGADAQEYLTANPFTQLVVEIDVMEGTDIAPDSSTVNLLQQRLNERCNKSSINAFVDDTIPASSNLHKSRYTVQDLLNIEAQFRDNQDSGSVKTLYIIALNGESEFDDQNRQVLGLAYTASSIGIFKDNIKDIANPPTQTSINNVENSVYVHEAGHNLGMVNNGVPMVNPHEDPDHEHHDTNQNCVMYFEVEVGLLQSSPPTQFDANCIQDMQAAGGK